MALDTKNWMSLLSDNLSLWDISIPGTHDSGTAKITDSITKGMAHTQNFSIDRQLEDGIRFMDIRLKLCGVELDVYHGPISCGINFTHVLKWCNDFLQKNKSETIIMSVKNEGLESQPIADAFRRYTTIYPNLFYRGKDLPLLKNAKGKIVLFNRFPFNDFGVDLTAWNSKGSKRFDIIASSGDLFNIDDQYECYDTNEKMNTIIRSSLYNAGQNKSSFYITFASIAVHVPALHSPYQYAWGGSGIDPAINPRLFACLTKTGTSLKRRLGVVVLDFHNNQGKDNYLVNAIIASNFNIDLRLSAYYYILSKSSFHFLGIAKPDRKNGTPLITCLFNNEDNQIFCLSRLQDGHMFFAKHSLLTLQLAHTNKEAPIVQYTINMKSPLQRWNIKCEKDDWFSITNVATKRCMTVESNGTRYGSYIIDCENTGWDNQLFRFIPAYTL
jgi:1-phosphatidylinositol phosphodiesterase